MDNTVESRLALLHTSLQEILDRVVEIRERHNLQYSLAYGTLIGAIRHNGFIPWDDDLDIVMPRKDYLRFIEYCKTELPNQYYYQGVENEKKYWLVFGKVRKKDTLFIEEHIDQDRFPMSKQGIFIDIFPIDGVKNNKKVLLLYNKIIRKIAVIMHGKITKRSHIAKDWISDFIPKSICLLVYNIIVKIATSNKPDYYVDLELDLSKSFQFYSVDNNSKRMHLEKHVFEGKEYWIPVNYHEALMSVYGEYWVLPPKSERKAHLPIELEF